jgi:hypothetical protein
MVRRFGTGLNVSLAQHLPEFESVEDSRAAEHELGERLHKAGYCVFGAH